MFCRLKGIRLVATRYDRLTVNFLGAVYRSGRRLLVLSLDLSTALALYALLFQRVAFLRLLREHLVVRIPSPRK